MSFNVVLVHPQIPPNTGNIVRLCAATKSVLHLIKPLGFTIDDKKLKRAGLDYWEHVEIHVHENIDRFLENHNPERFAFLSSKVEQKYWDHKFNDGDYLIFGSETTGIPQYVMEKYKDKFLTIPQYNEHVRCLNLSNSVSIVLYEALRQNNIF